jgi:sec-independent protein translocase protein TatB
MTSLQKDVSDSLQIGDIDKPVDAQVAAAVGAPAAPSPETLVQAEAHAAVNEPLAITGEVEPQPAPQDVAPAEPEVLKDAKAS